MKPARDRNFLIALSGSDLLHRISRKQFILRNDALCNVGIHSLRKAFACNHCNPG